MFKDAQQMLLQEVTIQLTKSLCYNIYQRTIYFPRIGIHMGGNGGKYPDW